MLQTNYTLTIDFDIKCENETLKKVVGAATVHNAETTGELWHAGKANVVKYGQEQV